MRGPSLQKTALLSLALHMTAFVIVFLILRQSNHIVMPSPYTVNLVSPEVLTGIDKGKNEDVLQESAEPSAPPDISRKSRKEVAEEKEKEKELIAKRINALRQKKTIKEKMDAIKGKDDEIRKLAKHRKIISLRAGNEKGDVTSKKAVASAGKGEIPDEYYSKIEKEIRDQWYCPPQICKNGLQAVISIRIFKDGTVIEQGMEKSSGNTIFDRLAKQAIKKANPLSPPPYEMDIGVRFP